MSGISDDGVTPRVSTTSRNADMICYYVALGVSTLFFVASLASVLLVYSLGYPINSSLQFLILTVAGNFITSTASSFLVLYRKKYRDDEAITQEPQHTALYSVPQRPCAIHTNRIAHLSRQTVTPPPPYEESQIFARHNYENYPLFSTRHPVIQELVQEHIHHTRRQQQPVLSTNRVHLHCNHSTNATASAIPNRVIVTERTHSAPIDTTMSETNINSTCVLQNPPIRSSSVPLTSSQPVKPGTKVLCALIQQSNIPVVSSSTAAVSTGARPKEPRRHGSDMKSLKPERAKASKDSVLSAKLKTTQSNAGDYLEKLERTNSAPSCLSTKSKNGKLLHSAGYIKNQTNKFLEQYHAIHSEAIEHSRGIALPDRMKQNHQMTVPQTCQESQVKTKCIDTLSPQLHKKQCRSQNGIPNVGKNCQSQDIILGHC